MKKFVNTVIYLLLAISYALPFSIGVECLLRLLGCMFAISLDGNSVIKQYPRFIPFCLIVGILALAALFFLVNINIKHSEKLNYTRRIWVLQSICAFVISLPMIKIWELLFNWLQKVF